MLNQEQLAAIAAAMSLVQQTLQQGQQQSAASTMVRPQPPQPPQLVAPQPSPLEVVKASQPISYSAVVAKSAGSTSNSAANSNNNTGAPTYTLNHNLESDIFNTHIASGLGYTNGSSSLMTHQNSNNIIVHEPTTTLDNYAVEHPIIPAHHLFNPQQNHSFPQDQMQSNNILQLQQQQQLKTHPINSELDLNIGNNQNNSRDKHTPALGRATNLLGFMGLYVGNLSPDLTKEQLEKIFSKYGEPVKAHRLIRSPVAFIKYDNTESPRAAIDDLFGVLLPELTLNQDQPLKLHFDRNDAQLKANYRPTELPKEDNGECYGWRTTVCRRGKSCTKKHIPINRGIDFQMWMIKNNLTTVSGTTTS